MVDKILNSFDVWIGAQGWKSRLKLKSIDNISLEGITRLRGLILDLAIRGKLVPQDKADEPASVLIEKIINQRERLFNEGKIKNFEVLSDIRLEEKKNDLPRGWEWIKLGYVTEFINGYAFKSTDFNSEGVGIVKIGDIQKGEVNTSDMSRVEIDVVGQLDANLKVNKGDLLIAMSGATTGKLGFNKSDEVFYINQRVGKIVPYFINKHFVFIYLSTKIAENLRISQGSAIPNLSTAQIKNIVVALPPLREQHRIVAKVDELMALCDELEQQETNHLKSHQLLVETLLGTLSQAKDAVEFQTAWATLAQHFDDLFITEDSIDQLKQTILQLAVMGKLVKQDPKDEPAGVLLERIGKEKERLIETKEIRKQKPVLEIKEDDKPFEIPKGWEWCRLGDIGRFTGGGTPSMSRQEYWDGNIPWISPKDMWNEYIADAEMKITLEGVENSTAKLIPQGSLLIVARSGILKRRLPVAINTVECSVNQDIKVLIPYSLEMSRFLLLMFSGLEKYILNRFVKIGTTVHSLKYEEFEMMAIAMPPVSEQNRIIKKVDELILLCDQLKDRLIESQRVENLMTEAILKQVI